MSKKIEKLRAELYKAYQDDSSDNTVKVTLTFTSSGFNTEIEGRTRESLRDEGISMKNLKNEYI